jgi:hypothetical protein
MTAYRLFSYIVLSVIFQRHTIAPLSFDSIMYNIAAVPSCMELLVVYSSDIGSDRFYRLNMV